MYWALFPVLLTLPTWAYLKSDFVGWSEPRGGEIFALVGIVASFAAALRFDIIKTKKQKSVFLGAIALWSALSVGALLPWLNSPPFWAAAGGTRDSLSISASGGFEGRVAHAGGALNGVSYTNSLEALNVNVMHYDIFEIDLLRTSDGVIVCAHDWPGYWRAAGESLFHAPSYSEFLESSLRLPWTPCDLESLNSWMSDNPDKKIILDSKSSDAVSIYAEARRILNDKSSNVYPQIYNINNFEKVDSMNWAGVLWSLYKRPMPVSRVLDLSVDLDLSAIVISRDIVGSHAEPLIEAGRVVYVHTVNEFEELLDLKNIGIEDVYSDVLREN